MKNKLICSRCNKEIEPEDKWVHIEDICAGKVIIECFLHYVCWKNLYEDKMKEQIKKTAEQFSHIFPGIKNIIGEME